MIKGKILFIIYSKNYYLVKTLHFFCNVIITCEHGSFEDKQFFFFFETFRKRGISIFYCFVYPYDILDIILQLIFLIMLYFNIVYFS